MFNSLSRAERLRGEKRIAALFADGRWCSAGVVRCCYVVASGEHSNSQSSSSHPLGGRGETKNFQLSTASVLFSTPKKTFKHAHDRNLLKRRMRESYRTRKHVLDGLRVDIAFICSPRMPETAPKQPRPKPEIPDFKTIDNAIEKILEQIVARG